jgi:catechol 2,3-dioxygenase-like lactoylglutathione lyase family enzyme
MVGFLRDALGMRVELDEPSTTELSFANGDRIQVFGPGHEYERFFGAHATGPVALFEVDDIDAGRAALDAAGVEVVGDVESDANWAWVNFRAPDANLYAIGSRLSR